MAGIPKTGVNSSDERTLDSDNNLNKPKPNKGKKRKNKFRDNTAPRQPLTGYIRFTNSRREPLRAENPSLTFADITKILAQEWSNLPPDEKRPYQEAGEQDRERYLQEMDAYKKTEAYKEYCRLQQQMKQKGAQENKKQKTVVDTNEEVTLPNSKQSDFHGFDIPIFTEEFLDHNKAREAELRQLRKLSTDHELQNASLSRIVESMRAAVTSLEADTTAQRANNAALSRHLDQLRASLAAAFHAVPLPDTNERPTVDSIDGYMQRLHALLVGQGASQHTQLLARVSGIVERLDLHG